MFVRMMVREALGKCCFLDVTPSTLSRLKHLSVHTSGTRRENAPRARTVPPRHKLRGPVRSTQPAENPAAERRGSLEGAGWGWGWARPRELSSTASEMKSAELRRASKTASCRWPDWPVVKCKDLC